MASARAFGLFNSQNRVHGNHIAGKNMQSLKTGETRPSAAFALKDLTNNNKAQRTNVHQAAGKDKSAVCKPEKQQKDTTKNIMQKISLNSEKPTHRKPAVHAPFDIFSPQDAEFSWGQAACLRDDLFEQMVGFHGVPCEIERKPLSPAPVQDLDDLQDLEPVFDDYVRPANDHRFGTAKLIDLPDDFALVDIHDLEFMF
uniref:Uncharacterized protein n=1 Tax=Anopheles farauti TaxID=69004 RepID=A0A182QA59_9DIPT